MSYGVIRVILSCVVSMWKVAAFRGLYETREL